MTIQYIFTQQKTFFLYFIFFRLVILMIYIYFFLNLGAFNNV